MRDDLVGRVVERDHIGAAAGELERVAAEAGAGVEHEVAGPHARARRIGWSARAQILPFLRSFSTFARHGQHLAVLVDGELRAVLPAPPLDHALAAGGADAGAQLGVVEPAADGRGERLDVAGLAAEHGVAVACP